MILNSMHSKEYYSTLKIISPDSGFSIIPAEYFDSILRGVKENEYSKNCSGEDGYMLGIMDDYRYGDTFYYVFPSLGDLVYYIQYHFIKQHEISFETDFKTEINLETYVLSKKSQDLIKLIDNYIENSESEEELYINLRDMVMNKYYPEDYSIFSIQEFIEEIFEEEPIEKTSLVGIFWKENGKWKCNQWEYFEEFVNDISDSFTKNYKM